MNQIRSAVKVVQSVFCTHNKHNMSSSMSSSESESELLCDSDCSECLEKERQDNSEKLAEKILFKNTSVILGAGSDPAGAVSFSNANVGLNAVAAVARASRHRHTQYYQYKSLNDTSLNLDNYAQASKRRKINLQDNDKDDDNLLDGDQDFDMESVLSKIKNGLKREQDQLNASRCSHELSLLLSRANIEDDN